MSERFVDRLEPVLYNGDVAGARALLGSLTGADLREAREWFGGNRRWLAGRSERFGDNDPYRPDWEGRLRASYEADWIVAMCAVTLCGPVTAAARVPWRDFWDFRDTDPGELAFVELLERTDRAWAGDFVEAASRVSLGGDARHAGEVLSRVLRAVAVHHGLPCPSGATFLKSWWAAPGEEWWKTSRQADKVAARLAADPFMPDLLLHLLASGHCGDLPVLPDAVAQLHAAGTVPRDRVVERVLVALTSPQRPKSQDVLVRVASRLGLRAEEVPGGLTYLLGVLSTSHRSVVRELLPLALELVEDGDGLVQLAALLAGRPDKRPKETLLAAVRSSTLASRAGAAAVRESLAVLGTGDDAAFSAKVARVAAAFAADAGDAGDAGDAADVGDAGEATGDRPAPLGLWDLPPTPVGIEEGWLRADEMHLPGVWEYVLRRPDGATARGRRETQAYAVDRTLRAMADDDTLDPGPDLRRTVGALMADEELSVSGLVALLEGLFLGGGLSRVWPAALAATEDVYGFAWRPAGMASLLRTLARYVDEVPLPQPLPPRLSALAAGRGATKEQAEARRLLAGLAGLPERSLLSMIRAAPPEASSPEPRGLWDARAEPDGDLPSFRRLPDAPHGHPGDLRELRQLLSQHWNHGYDLDDVSIRPGLSGPDPSLAVLTGRDRVLAATVGAVHRHGGEAARRALAGIERRWNPPDVVLAVDAWIAGTLDLTAFWRVARGATTRDPAWPGATWDEIREACEDFVGRLARPDDPRVRALILPSELESGAEQFAFLRAAEALLRAEAHPTVLSTPTWADGTLDLDDLLSRLAVAAREGGEVGPLDLVQALHRLRPADPGRAAEVPDGLRTDPAFTDPAGTETWDATHLVRTWLEQGGLPPLDPIPDADGRWSTAVTAPVPFTRLAALPAALAGDPWTPGPFAASLRMMPRWADRLVEEAFAEWTDSRGGSFPGLAAGPFGVPLHDWLLALATAPLERWGESQVQIVAAAARRGRLDLATAVEAATGRHRAGTLQLAALTVTFRRAFERNGLRGLWPVCTAIADALCGEPDRPADLPGFLDLLRAYAHEVPAACRADVPKNLLALADADGGAPSHREARRLVEALGRAGAE